LFDDDITFLPTKEKESSQEKKEKKAKKAGKAEKPQPLGLFDGGEDGVKGGLFD